MKKTIVFGTIIILAGILIMCEKEGPAEKAGKKIDQQVERAKEVIDNTGEILKNSVNNDGPMENAGEKIDQIVEDAKEQLDELAEEVKHGGEGPAQRAGEKVDDIVNNTRKKMQDLLNKE